MNVGRSAKSGLDNVRNSFWGALDPDGFGVLDSSFRLGPLTIIEWNSIKLANRNIVRYIPSSRQIIEKV